VHDCLCIVYFHIKFKIVKPFFKNIYAFYRMDSLSGSLKHSAIVSPTSPGSPNFFDRATSPHMITKAVQNIRMGMYKLRKG